MAKWFLKNNKKNIEEIAKKHHISRLLSKLLVNRGIIDDELIDKFIHPTLENLRDARKMKDVQKAVELLKYKIDEQKKIRIIGDYDVDGIISTYVLYTAFKRCGANVDYTIPDRIKDGYGVSKHLVDQAILENVDTIITCDNGIAALEPLGYAKERGLTVIVTDHHNIPFLEDENGNRVSQIPKVDAVINPKQADCAYPFKELCGAGVALKLVQVLYEEMAICKNEYTDFVEFVAIATVCDVVELIDENRIIVKEGLEKISSTHNIGLKVLIDELELKNSEITTYHLGYVLGPTFNATGRLETASQAIRLLDTTDPEEARVLAKKFMDLNSERKEMTLEGTEKAISIIEKEYVNKEKVFVLYMPHIHESLAGIIAGRIKERYYTPTIVLTDVHDGVKGSGRSIEGYNMFEELSKNKDLLKRFGGHPLAAGLALEKSDVDVLRQRLNEQTSLKEEDLIPKLTLDMRLGLENISYKLVEELQKLEPYGKGNPKPLFGEKHIRVVQATLLGKNNNVLRLQLVSKEGRYFTAIYFGEISAFEEVVKERYGQDKLRSLYEGKVAGVYLDMAFELGLNEYRGNTNIQLVVQEFR